MAVLSLPSSLSHPILQNTQRKTESSFHIFKVHQNTDSQLILPFHFFLCFSSINECTNLCVLEHPQYNITHVIQLLGIEQAIQSIVADKAGLFLKRLIQITITKNIHQRMNMRLLSSQTIGKLEFGEEKRGKKRKI